MEENFKNSEQIKNYKKLSQCNLSVEKILDSLGGFSRFQFLATIIIILPEIPAAMISLSPVLTGSTKVFYECQNEENVTMILNTNMSHICSLNCTILTLSVDPIKPFSSIVQEWNLICEYSWIVELFTSIQMMGSMVGAIVSSHLADKLGRKKIFFSICGMMGIFGFASSLVFNPYLFAVCRFFAGYAIGGCFVVYLNYLMEFLSPKSRTICGCVSLWAVGEMLLALFSYLLPGWRNLTAVTSIPVFIIFAFINFLPESPRWYLVHGRTKDAIKAFNKIAQINGKCKVNEDEIYHLQDLIQLEQSINKENNKGRKVGLFEIIKSKKYRLKLSIFIFAWFTNGVIYYSITFNMKNLSGDPHLNVFYMGLADFPGCFAPILFNNRFGRKRTFLGFMIPTIVLLSSIIIVHETYLSIQYPEIITLLCVLSKFCISASFAVMVCFTGESFPTLARVTCMGFCALAGNFGSILAPGISYLGFYFPQAELMPYLAYCTLAILTACLAILLKDTNGKPLKDNLDLYFN